MTIPSTSFQLSDDGTEAWWVVRPVHRMGVTNTVGDDYDDPSWFMSLNRPCDKCKGEKRLRQVGTGDIMACYACDGTGRDTFKIEVGHEHTGWTADKKGDCEGCAAEFYGENTYHVHVLDVLPIVGGDIPGELDRNDLHVLQCSPGEFRVYEAGWWDDPHIDSDYSVNLPPDAAPGKWAVRLAVHA